MSWNNALEQGRFRRQLKRNRSLYRRYGMSEEAIRELEEFDKETFRSDRKFYTRTCSLEEIIEPDETSEQNKWIPKELCCNLEDCPGYSELWLEEIEDPKLFSIISSLDEAEKQLIYYAWVRELPQVDVALLIGTDQYIVSRALSAIRARIIDLYSLNCQACDDGDRKIAGGHRHA